MKKYIPYIIIVLLFVLGSDRYGQSLNLDRITGVLNTIDYAHHEIHNGSSYVAYFSDGTPTNIGERTIIAFETGSEKYCHMFVEASSTAGSTITICELTSLDDGEGTDLTIWNRNRDSTNTSTVMTIEEPVNIGKATSFTQAQATGAQIVIANTIWSKYLGSAAAGTDTSGESRDEHEFILKKSTKYAFIITNTSDDTNTHNIVLNWYEHINK